MKRWCWALLIFELALFALILILPQVDLPAFAFHGGTAPLIVKARLLSAPWQALALVVAQTWFSLQLLYGRSESLSEIPASDPHSRLSLLCTLLCSLHFPQLTHPAIFKVEFAPLGRACFLQARSRSSGAAAPIVAVLGTRARADPAAQA